MIDFESDLREFLTRARARGRIVDWTLDVDEKEGMAWHLKLSIVLPAIRRVLAADARRRQAAGR